ncbi:hypothetical protein B0H19DRAFT_1382859 [Mycena capillaripes]|nr:hypothetical protein B0H19DRAFT_1382859 [Mycena capillaripes]
MISQWAFQKVLQVLESRDLLLMAECKFGSTFEASSVQEDAWAYVFQRGGRFRPVIFGEVKEIVTTAAQADCVTIGLGLPRKASQMVDTFYWNQLNELDYTMRRESADNDSLLHLLPSGNYIPIRKFVPWSCGPSGDATDRVFIQFPPRCKINRRLPSSVRLAYDIFPSNFWASVIALDNTQELITCADAPPSNLPPITTLSTLSDEEISSFDSEEVEEEDNDWRSLTIGDFIVVLSSDPSTTTASVGFYSRISQQFRSSQQFSRISSISSPPAYAYAAAMLCLVTYQSWLDSVSVFSCMLLYP